MSMLLLHAVHSFIHSLHAFQSEHQVQCNTTLLCMRCEVSAVRRNKGAVLIAYGLSPSARRIWALHSALCR